MFPKISRAKRSAISRSYRGLALFRRGFFLCADDVADRVDRKRFLACARRVHIERRRFHLRGMQDGTDVPGGQGGIDERRQRVDAHCEQFLQPRADHMEGQKEHEPHDSDEHRDRVAQDPLVDGPLRHQILFGFVGTLHVAALSGWIC